jgi:hypothetical protein
MASLVCHIEAAGYIGPPRAKKEIPPVPATGSFAVPLAAFQDPLAPSLNQINRLEKSQEIPTTLPELIVPMLMPVLLPLRKIGKPLYIIQPPVAFEPSEASGAPPVAMPTPVSVLTAVVKVYSQ